MNPDGITAGSSLRRTIELDDMPDRDYFRHTAGELLNKSTEFNVENLKQESISCRKSNSYLTRMTRFNRHIECATAQTGRSKKGSQI